MQKISTTLDIFFKLNSCKTYAKHNFFVQIRQYIFFENLLWKIKSQLYPCGCFGSTKSQVQILLPRL